LIISGIFLKLGKRSLMKILKILFVCLIFSSCNSPRVVYDYDDQIDFSTYNTYGIYPDLMTELSQLDERRLLNSLEKVLQETILMRDLNPDLFLNVYSEEFRERSGNSLGVGIGGGGGNVGVGMSGGIPIGGAKNYLQLTFDLIDVTNDLLVWQAVVEAPFNLNARPEKRQQTLQEMVEKAFAKYPPKK